MSMTWPLIVSGAGPVGMCAALEAASRGVQVLVIEASSEDRPADAKCNSVAARTMETFRRFGVADRIRSAGLPDDFPADVIYTTSVAGPELTRISMPSRTERATQSADHWIDGAWRTAEAYVRVSQLFVNPVLARRMRETAGITVHYDTEVTGYIQDANGVEVTIRDAVGKKTVVRGQYLIGADGGRSAVRRVMGVKLDGDAELARTRTTLIRAPGLKKLFAERRAAWMSWVVNHKVRGVVVAIDGEETWLVHRVLPEGETHFDSLDKHQSILDVLGVAEEFQYEILRHEDWIGRRLVAERMRDRRVFLAGDAAHLWVPFAGYGMNAGIADGVSIAWLISNVLQGWAGESMLDAYEAERHPITEQVSRHAMQSMLETIEALGKSHPPPSLSSRFNPAGVAMRKVMGAKLNKLNIPQFAPEGLNFGYYYSESPIIIYDDEKAPGYTMGSITPSTVPGCRMPHFWLEPGVSVYDKLGPAYTLIRFAVNEPVAGLLEAARTVGMPLLLLDLPERKNDPAFRHRLVLVRQDQHVAWRGDSLPPDVTPLIEKLCGRFP